MLYMCNKGHLMSPTFKKLTFLSRQKFHIFSVFLLPWPRLVVLETEINLLIFESLILQPQFSLFICTSNKPSKQAAKALEFEKKILVTKFQRLNLSAICRSSNSASKVLAAININMQWKHKQQKEFLCKSSLTKSSTDWGVWRTILCQLASASINFAVYIFNSMDTHKG